MVSVMTETDIVSRLAERLRDARKAKGLSLEGVAALSGVSRSMVSQIERGTSSPTVATLWNLTQALGVDFAGLLEGGGAAAEAIEVQSAEATPTIDSQGSRCRIRILSPPEAAGRHEVYLLEFDAGGVLDSAAHGAGAREHLSVIAGRVSVRSGEAVKSLGEGDTARYAADVPHAISAEGGAARAFLIVQYNG